MNNARWSRLARFLNLFSTDVIERSAELWMAKIWLLYHSGQWDEILAALEHLNLILTTDPNQQIDNQAASHRLAGEINTLLGMIAYHSGDEEGARTYSRQALDQLSPKLWIVRVLTRNYWSGGLLLAGDISGAYHAHYDAFEEEKVQNRRFTATILVAASSFHWITADLQGLEQTAKRSIALYQETNLRQLLGFGHDNLGRVRYHQNDLSAAKELFSYVVARPYQNYGDVYTNSVYGLAMTYQAMGKEAEANLVTDETIAFLLETGNSTQLPSALSLQAELALKQGNLPFASQWAETLDPTLPLVPLFRFWTPYLTLVKVWLAQNTPDSQGKATLLLSQLEKYLTDTHSTYFLIETLALQTVLHQIRGEQGAAQESLNRALVLAQPGGFVRLFVELGEPIARLLATIEDEDKRPFIQKLLAAFPKATVILPNPLTTREMDVLELLAERWAGREIAKKLIISTHTVNSHIKNIYSKLGVHSRKKAVKRARKLNLLPR